MKRARGESREAHGHPSGKQHRADHGSQHEDGGSPPAELVPPIDAATLFAVLKHTSLDALTAQETDQWLREAAKWCKHRDVLGLEGCMLLCSVLRTFPWSRPTGKAVDPKTVAGYLVTLFTELVRIGHLALPVIECVLTPFSAPVHDDTTIPLEYFAIARHVLPVVALRHPTLMLQSVVQQALPGNIPFFRSAPKLHQAAYVTMLLEFVIPIEMPDDHIRAMKPFREKIFGVLLEWVLDMECNAVRDNADDVLLRNLDAVLATLCTELVRRYEWYCGLLPNATTSGSLTNTSGNAAVETESMPWWWVYLSSYHGSKFCNLETCHAVHLLAPLIAAATGEDKVKELLHRCASSALGKGHHADSQRVTIAHLSQMLQCPWLDLVMRTENAKRVWKWTGRQFHVGGFNAAVMPPLLEACLGLAVQEDVHFNVIADPPPPAATADGKTSPRADASDPPAATPPAKPAKDTASSIHGVQHALLNAAFPYIDPVVAEKALRHSTLEGFQPSDATVKAMASAKTASKATGKGDSNALGAKPRRVSVSYVKCPKGFRQMAAILAQQRQQGATDDAATSVAESHE